MPSAGSALPERVECGGGDDGQEDSESAKQGEACERSQRDSRPSILASR
jgi:hypothetical protein